LKFWLALFLLLGGARVFAARTIYFSTGTHPDLMHFTEARADRLDATGKYTNPDGGATQAGKLEFTLANVGTNSQTVSVTVFNPGGAALAAGWSPSSNCTLLPARTCNLTFTFSANANIPSYATIRVSESQGGVLANFRYRHQDFWSCCSGKPIDNGMTHLFFSAINGGYPF
jgi:hypothetical protein